MHMYAAHSYEATTFYVDWGFHLSLGIYLNSLQYLTIEVEF